MEGLSPRELEMLRYIARGMSKKEIAGAVHISVKTVDKHCANLMDKLDIHDRVELTRFAIREEAEVSTSLDPGAHPAPIQTCHRRPGI